MIGDLIHFVLQGGHNEGKCRAAIVLAENNGACNLAVFTDGQNDGLARTEGAYLFVRGVSQQVTDERLPHTWHHLERC